MNLLIIGNGAREHAFAWKISKSSHNVKVFVTNASPGIKEIAKSVELDLNSFNQIKDCIIQNEISFVIVGPEVPLIEGLTDFIKNDSIINNVLVIGPSKFGAQLEGSKDFAKDFMKRHNIPTAQHKTFTKNKIEEAHAYLQQLSPPYVLKADGPAAGKGVLIINDLDSAKAEVSEMLIANKFGAASNKVVIEEFLDGIEMSCFVLFDGSNYKILPYAKDYKRISEGDKGLNTGGMGSISPVSFLTEDLKNKIENKIIKPTVNGLIKEKIDYVGFIFIGLINVAGSPKVIEYNVRMGDPETQVVLPRIKNDLMDLLIACANKSLNKTRLEISSKHYVNVVLASKGYPKNYKKGEQITGFDLVKDSIIFHAGTAVSKKEVVTNGGRVLSVVSSANSMEDALSKSYDSIEKLSFKGKTYRSDIGFDL